MFTGIIEEMGTILEVAKGTHSAVLTIAAGKVLEHDSADFSHIFSL